MKIRHPIVPRHPVSYRGLPLPFVPRPPSRLLRFGDILHGFFHASSRFNFRDQFLSFFHSRVFTNENTSSTVLMSNRHYVCFHGVDSSAPFLFELEYLIEKRFDGLFPDKKKPLRELLGASLLKRS